ncbi:Protein CBG21416 [Caenorhabditis briggsae]|uniref:Protein CBG21416 n=1 Tax=Caenorhabditis briggsae TaxID=6238 RepID=A8Y009_CAEBR|nr:Protein CBG21416 [Caenorhabditis briggsae]CAP38226.2 Protein CBG21416 [Caenorhabditis briggsae]
MQNSQPGSFMGQVQWQCQQQQRQQQGTGHWEQLNQRFQNGYVGNQAPEMDLVHKMAIEIEGWKQHCAALYQEKEQFKAENQNLKMENQKLKDEAFQKNQAFEDMKLRLNKVSKKSEEENHELKNLREANDFEIVLVKRIKDLEAREGPISSEDAPTLEDIVDSVIDNKELIVKRHHDPIRDEENDFKAAVENWKNWNGRFETVEGVDEVWNQVNHKSEWSRKCAKVKELQKFQEAKRWIRPQTLYKIKKEPAH